MNSSRIIVAGGLQRASPARLLHVDQTLNAAVSRRPLIQFPKRSGQLLSYDPSALPSSSAAVGQLVNGSQMPLLVGTDQNIMPPFRFQRRPISDEECEVINVCFDNGGSYGTAPQLAKANS